MSRPLERVLMAEDEDDIRLVAQLALVQVGGLTVEMCPDGDEALRRVDDFAPDLILLDVMMPGRDGKSTLSELQRRPSSAGIPVVMMTAKVQQAEVAHYRELGAVSVIAKPFDPMTLATTLRDIWSTWCDAQD